jgi:hypothetical protein
VLFQQIASCSHPAKDLINACLHPNQHRYTGGTRRIHACNQYRWISFCDLIFVL